MEYSGDMGTARYSHTATLLADGRVPVSGGQDADGEFLRSCEIWDPRTGGWAGTGDLIRGRYEHRAVLLLDGRVLVGGGFNDSDQLLSQCELWDPGTGEWEDAGSMVQAREGHGACLLRDGRVLATGGSGDGVALESAEVWDPVRRVWRSVQPMTSRRSGHHMLTLPDGRVLAAGGRDHMAVWDTATPQWKEEYLSSVEAWSPDTNLWSTISPMNVPRVDHVVTLLPEGRVLVVGGVSKGSSYLIRTDLVEVEVWDAESGGWSLLEELPMHLGNLGAAPLAKGDVLVVGEAGREALHAIRWESSSGAWVYEPSPQVPRSGGVLIGLAGSSALLSGGGTQGPALRSEVWSPD